MQTILHTVAEYIGLHGKRGAKLSDAVRYALDIGDSGLEVTVVHNFCLQKFQNDSYFLKAFSVDSEHFHLGQHQYLHDPVIIASDKTWLLSLGFPSHAFFSLNFNELQRKVLEVIGMTLEKGIKQTDMPKFIGLPLPKFHHFLTKLVKMNMAVRVRISKYEEWYWRWTNSVPEHAYIIYLRKFQTIRAKVEASYHDQNLYFQSLDNVPTASNSLVVANGTSTSRRDIDQDDDDDEVWDEYNNCEPNGDKTCESSIEISREVIQMRIIDSLSKVPSRTLSQKVLFRQVVSQSSRILVYSNKPFYKRFADVIRSMTRDRIIEKSYRVYNGKRKKGLMKPFPCITLLQNQQASVFVTKPFHIVAELGIQNQLYRLIQQAGPTGIPEYKIYSKLGVVCTRVVAARLRTLRKFLFSINDNDKRARILRYTFVDPKASGHQEDSPLISLITIRRKNVIKKLLRERNFITISELQNLLPSLENNDLSPLCKKSLDKIVKSVVLDRAAALTMLNFRGIARNIVILPGYKFTEEDIKRLNDEFEPIPVGVKEFATYEPPEIEFDIFLAYFYGLEHLTLRRAKEFHILLFERCKKKQQSMLSSDALEFTSEDIFELITEFTLDQYAKILGIGKSFGPISKEERFASVTSFKKACSYLFAVEYMQYRFKFIRNKLLTDNIMSKSAKKKSYWLHLNVESFDSTGSKVKLRVDSKDSIVFYWEQHQIHNLVKKGRIQETQSHTFFIRHQIIFEKVLGKLILENMGLTEINEDSLLRIEPLAAINMIRAESKIREMFKLFSIYYRYKCINPSYTPQKNITIDALTYKPLVKTDVRNLMKWKMYAREKPRPASVMRPSKSKKRKRETQIMKTSVPVSNVKSEGSNDMQVEDYPEDFRFGAEIVQLLEPFTHKKIQVYKISCTLIILLKRLASDAFACCNMFDAFVLCCEIIKRSANEFSQDEIKYFVFTNAAALNRLNFLLNTSMVKHFMKFFEEFGSSCDLRYDLVLKVFFKYLENALKSQQSSERLATTREVDLLEQFENQPILGDLLKAIVRENKNIEDRDSVAHILNVFTTEQLEEAIISLEGPTISKRKSENHDEDMPVKDDLMFEMSKSYEVFYSLGRDLHQEKSEAKEESCWSRYNITRYFEENCYDANEESFEIDMSELKFSMVPKEEMTEVEKMEIEYDNIMPDSDKLEIIKHLCSDFDTVIMVFNLLQRFETKGVEERALFDKCQVGPEKVNEALQWLLNFEIAQRFHAGFNNRGPIYILSANCKHYIINRSESLPGEPIRPWSRLDGTTDWSMVEALTEIIERKITNKPGIEESVLIASLSDSNVAASAIHDVLFAMELDGLLNRRTIYEVQVSLFQSSSSEIFVEKPFLWSHGDSRPKDSKKRKTFYFPKGC